MTTGVVSKKYVSHYQKKSRKKKKVKARFTGIFYIIGKRIFDVVASLLISVLILSWLIPLLAVLIKLDSKGPVFFVQTRIGFLGIPFRCFKLRTMQALTRGKRSSVLMASSVPAWEWLSAPPSAFSFMS